MPKSTKLHELLAVESNLENQANKTRAELINTFEKKRHLFEEKIVSFTPTGENVQSTIESQLSIQTSVQKELDWVQGFLAKSLDASFQVADANTKARADIVLEDEANTVLVKDVPATALLELEKRLTDILNLVNAVPTLDPAKGFELDAQRTDGVYKAREVIKNRTRKEKKVLIRYEATKEHPAQTELIEQDVVIGTIRESEWSGLITPAEKSEILSRVEMLTRAVRRARSRANEQEVDLNKKIGKTLLNYIFG